MLKAYLVKKLWHFTIDIKFQIKNQILVLWGPSGSGKTTILHCLAGLSEPDSGYIQLNDRILYSSEQRVNLPARRRQVGFVFQDYALFPHLNVRQNVLYGVSGRSHRSGPSLDRREALQLLDDFGIGHLSDRYPGQLSGGEKQRVAIARALSVKPRLLLLDEPFSALDEENKIVLRQEIIRLHTLWQIPFILVTHDQEDARELGHLIITLERGVAIERPTRTLRPTLVPASLPADRIV